MFLSNLKEAKTKFNEYLPRAGKYYSNKRNYSFDIENQTTTTSNLSPYIRYRLISEQDVIKKVLSTHSFSNAEKFIQEIFWRTYWKGWLEHRENVYDDYLNDRDLLLKNLKNDSFYKKVINAETTINFFNDWVIKLKNNGYLHNHERMWFASIWIFTFNLPWQLGANFFMEKLLDGDPASNTLSWRWVAGIQTKGKNYLARKHNIEKFSNIKINNLNLINEKAECKIDNRNYECKNIKFSNNLQNIVIDSILIPSDELNFLENYKQNFSLIFSGIPFEDYNDHKFSEKIKSHIVKIIKSNFKDNVFYKHLNVELHFENYYQNFKKWIKRNNIKGVAIPYVTKGNWRKIYNKLISENPAVNFVYLNRNYDKEAWKFSKKGFFNFKKHIPELITKL